MINDCNVQDMLWTWFSDWFIPTQNSAQLLVIHLLFVHIVNKGICRIE